MNDVVIVKAFQNYVQEFPHFTQEVMDKIIPHLSVQNIAAIRPTK